MRLDPMDLPVRLRNSSFRLIKLGSEGQKLKVPIEVVWNIFYQGLPIPRRPKFRGRLNNYTCDDPQLQEWLRRGRIYGIPSAGGRIKLESDDIARWKVLDVLSILPDTFMVQRRIAYRQHFYFDLGTDAADTFLFDPATRDDIDYVRVTGEAASGGGKWM